MEFAEIQGAKVPVLGLGTWQMSGAVCRDSVLSAIQMGYRHIDTAQAYENEEYVGEALSRSGVRRDQIFLTTKIWITNFRRDDVLASFSESLKKLRTDYIDLLLMHWPNSDVPFEETLEAMEGIVRGRGARHIGVSNFPLALLKDAVKHSGIFSNQVEYHVFLSQKKILDYCQKHDILLTAYSPLARGLVNGNDVLKSIGEKYNKSPGQVALRWLTQQKNVAAIPKAISREHQKENLEIFDFRLSHEEMDRIDTIERGERLISPGFAPDWD